MLIENKSDVVQDELAKIELHRPFLEGYHGQSL